MFGRNIIVIGPCMTSFCPQRWTAAGRRTVIGPCMTSFSCPQRWTAAGRRTVIGPCMTSFSCPQRWTVAGRLTVIGPCMTSFSCPQRWTVAGRHTVIGPCMTSFSCPQRWTAAGRRTVIGPCMTSFSCPQRWTAAGRRTVIGRRVTSRVVRAASGRAPPRHRPRAADPAREPIGSTETALKRTVMVRRGWCRRSMVMIYIHILVSFGMSCPMCRVSYISADEDEIFRTVVVESFINWDLLHKTYERNIARDFLE